MTSETALESRAGLVEIDGEQFYMVEDVDQMPPFLMSLVSDGDRWMFISSSGALTAGRRDADGALFPYVTDDRLHAAGGRTGAVTRIRVTTETAETMWTPFEGRPNPHLHRRVAKAVVGHSVVFEERHLDLGLTFRYRWSSSERFGFVRTATIENLGQHAVAIDALDGLVDLLPYGLEPALYNRLSNLTHAYKRSEVVNDDLGLAVYSLEAPVSDQAEPEEVLRATVAWSTGLEGRVSVDAGSVASFERGHDTAASLATGTPGAYLVRGEFTINAGATKTWHVVADVACDQLDVARLRRTLRVEPDLGEWLEADTRRTGQRLVQILAPADALQRTGDHVASAHHFANVTYNVMRGGVPLAGYQIDSRDFRAFLDRRHRGVAARHASWLSALPDTIARDDLLSAAAERALDTGDVHVARLADEYVPLSFSRRHGDPSRPWNQFSIRVTDESGRPVVYYEGNWRDVFQNWEALCESFPELLPSVISIFVNASTADGHNPYRVTADGIEWEEPDPDDPWSNIGYWGDHQIVYLLRLLEAAERYLPGELARRLSSRVHTYADVPYRIVPYDSLVRDPKDTIRFDADGANRSSERVSAIGGDGKLLVDGDGEIVVVTLLEKLLVGALAKLSNYVPGGGIWMNTQRPEWNDANNALVGYGTSMVTLFHLRRYLDHLRTLMLRHDLDVSISAEVASWLSEVAGVFRSMSPAPDADDHRREILDALGQAASRYRTALYDVGFSGVAASIDADAIVELCDAALAHLDESIDLNRRPDGLMHSYNLVDLTTDGVATIGHLHEMLEGQVAALSCGQLTSSQHADLLDALFASALYRADQSSFMLAPAVRPLGFLDKNVVDQRRIDSNQLLLALEEAGEQSVIRRDVDGTLRFAPDLVTADQLESRLDQLARDERWESLVARHRRATLDVYESVFEHRSYVGRSGSMYAYEGIGSIYWHMVSKLLLAVQEVAVDADRQGAPADDVARLVAAYWRVRDGLGFNKSAEEFGAVPIDPYSHSPAHTGAQQPGMTGAVKEEILARRRELGVSVVDGEVVFDSLLLRQAEMLEHQSARSVTLPDGREVEVDLEAGTLGVTFCQIPVVVVASTGEPYVDIEFADGHTERLPGLRVSRDISRKIFGRTGELEQLRAVGLVPS